MTAPSERSFVKLDTAIFLAKRVETEPEILPPRPLRAPPEPAEPAPEWSPAQPRRPLEAKPPQSA